MKYQEINPNGFDLTYNMVSIRETSNSMPKNVQGNFNLIYDSSTNQLHLFYSGYPSKVILIKHKKNYTIDSGTNVTDLSGFFSNDYDEEYPVTITVWGSVIGIKYNGGNSESFSSPNRIK